MMSIVGRALLNGVAFYYDKRIGLMIPDSIVAKKYCVDTPQTVYDLQEVIQIDRNKNIFTITVASSEGVDNINITYDEKEKTFQCNKYDPRKLIPIILENEDTKLYFMSRNHPYYDKHFVPNYGDDDVVSKVTRTVESTTYKPNPYRNQYLKNVLNDMLKEDVDHNKFMRRFIDDDVEDEKKTTVPTEDENESIWDKYYQSRIQEPDSDSGCDSDGCRHDLDGCRHDIHHLPQITAGDMKEIDELFGSSDDKSTRSLINDKKPIRSITYEDDSVLNEFTNDNDRRVSTLHTPQSTDTYGNLHMRLPLYKLPTYTDLSEDEKRIALLKRRFIMLKSELEYEKAIKESYDDYYIKLRSDQKSEHIDTMVNDDPVKPNEYGVIVKPPKLPEREDNL